MARILMIGYGPMPRLGISLFLSPSLRTRHFLKPLLDDGHTVDLFTLPVSVPEGPEGEVAALVPDEYEGLEYRRFSNHSGEFAILKLNEQVAQLKPDAIVGVNTYPSYVGAMLSTTVPLWCDLNGYWMAEMQGKCCAEWDDSHLMNAWSIERTILRRLDKFSAVSRPQLHAVLGEMASIGRLNKHTFTYAFGAHVPNAYYRWETPEEVADEPVLRGPVCPQDAFIVLWSGGFNLWTDVEMLLSAMNELMRRRPQVHFVSTGGRIDGVDTKTYRTFQEGVERSEFKDRFHLLGWVESEKLPRIYRESNVGLNIDGPNYETFFGARNRLNAMAAEDLPIVTTLGTEISEWLYDGQAALTCQLGDSDSLVEAIDPWVGNREELKAYAERAKKIMENDFSYERTTRALLTWLKEPKNAPDNEAKIRQSGGELADLNAEAVNTLEAQAMMFETYDARTLNKLKRELESLQRRPWFRAYRKIRRLMDT